MVLNKHRILVRLEQQLATEVKKQAQLETRSMNSLIVHALKTYISWKQEV